MLRNGADPNKKNRSGHSKNDFDLIFLVFIYSFFTFIAPLDLAKDEEVRDLLISEPALLDAAKSGNLQRVMKLLTPENVNCKDTEGRNSTALHLASGYNNIEVAKYLLEHGAQVDIPDKGGWFIF